MRIMTTMMNICMALLLPMSATAKQPVADGCEILVASTIAPDSPFTVTVAKKPAYPGQWVAPEVSVEVTAPLNADLEPGPNSYSQTVDQQIDGLGGSNHAIATFIIPAFSNLDLTGAVHVFATVAEPVNKGKSVNTYCESVTGFM